MAWMSGHSLSQTIYTCLYFHHVPTLATEPPANLNMDDPVDVIYTVLKAYILATVRCCQLVWSEMTLGNVYEVSPFRLGNWGVPSATKTSAFRKRISQPTYLASHSMSNTRTN